MPDAPHNAPSLLLDENVHQSVANTLRHQGYDVEHVGGLRLKGSIDEPVLILAVRLQRTLVTYDIGDFTVLFDNWARAGKEHYGIIVSHQLDHGTLLTWLTNVLIFETKENLMNRLCFLKEYRTD
ncbi:MAG: DUF5615 family PIN-like protein [Chloroflexi bacterium]|nr:DUF5615 family PIN-like protein [Chloroflexota bacterium]